MVTKKHAMLYMRVMPLMYSCCVWFIMTGAAAIWLSAIRMMGASTVTMASGCPSQTQDVVHIRTDNERHDGKVPARAYGVFGGRRETPPRGREGEWGQANHRTYIHGTNGRILTGVDMSIAK